MKTKQLPQNMTMSTTLKHWNILMAGLQGYPQSPAIPWALPIGEKLLPQVGLMFHQLSYLEINRRKNKPMIKAIIFIDMRRFFFF